MLANATFFSRKCRHPVASTGMIGRTVDSHQNPGRAADGTDADETKAVKPADPGGEETRSVERGGSAEAETRILRSEGEPGTYERLNELAVGTRFAGYVIEAEIARGEMGIVYRARNMRLERIEALKVIAPRYAADAGFRARFRREAMHAVIADHSHVVRVYDADEHDGHLYMAMQFVDGVDLRKRLARDGALAPNVAVEITSQVASALDAAHANGLIHRDVKPSNILLAEVSEVPDAYLSDFGVSRRLAMPSDLTQPGSVVGTPYYTAPEQHDGKASDHRSDVYSLGCVLFETLTGRHPFEGDSVTAVALAHLQQPVPSVTGIDDRLPPAFDRVLAKAMAKDPDERYQSAGQLAADAQAAAEGKADSTDATLALPAPADPEPTLTLPAAPAPARAPARDRRATAPVRSEPASRPRRKPRVLAGQLAALAACLAVAALARWGHSYIGYGHGTESLWDATRRGGDASSPLRAVDFRNVIALVALAFVLIACSLGLFRRALTFTATLVALLVIGQLLRFALGLGPHWQSSHTVGLSFWLSLGAAVLIALGAGVAASAPRAPKG